MKSTQPIPDHALIESKRLRSALRELVEIQCNASLTAHMIRMRAWNVLDALDPQLAMLPRMEALKVVMKE